MVKKIALFAFNGEPMCFAHALLNTLDMKEKGYDVNYPTLTDGACSVRSKSN